MTRFRALTSGEPNVDRCTRDLADQLNRDRRSKFTSFATDVRTISAADDAAIAKIRSPMELRRLFINVDATIALDTTNWWSLRLVYYRPGFDTAFGIQPVRSYAGDEYIKTSKVPITAYRGIEIEYEQSLEEGDLLVLEFTVGGGSPTNFTKTFIQADFLPR